MIKKKLIDANHLRNWIKTCANPYGRPTLDYNTALQVMDMIDMMSDADKWIPCSDMLPDDEEDMVLIQVSGKYEDITFDNALEIASYSQEEGWILEAYPDWEGAHPIAWMPMPELYKEG